MKHSSDVFRPKLPFDPFTDLDVDQPWLINPADAARPIPPRVILVLGAPSQVDLQSLLSSHWLSDSLVLIATHAPPMWVDGPVPIVRILRLQKPLEQGGGRELASLYDRAERIAHQWRNQRLPYPDKKVAQLAEKFPGGDFNVLESYAVGNAASGFPSSARRPPPASSKSKRSSATSVFRAQFKTVPGITQDQRTFDAILHFLPASLPEKDIFKRAILVTTLSVSFLSSVPTHQIPSHTDPPKRRFTALLRSKRNHSPSYDSSSPAPLPPVCYAHLVHVLPPAPATPPTPPSTLTPSSSTSSISSGPSFQKPPFLARHLSPPSASKQPSLTKLNSSAAAFYIPPLDSDSSNTNSRSHPQPIFTPMHAKFVSERQSGRPGLLSAGGRKKLAQSVEQFLIQFTYSSQMTSYPGEDLPGSQSRYVPYLLASGVFSRAVRAQGNSNATAEDEVEAQVSEPRLTVGEAIILSLLDTCARGNDTSNNPKSIGKLATRAWIGERQEVSMVPGSVVKATDDAMSDSLPRSASIRAPASVRSPAGKEAERENMVIREDDFFEGLNAILSPRPYPSFQNTPLPWALPNHASRSERSDSTRIKRPAAIVPRMHIPLSPPLSVDELVVKSTAKSEDFGGTPQNKSMEKPTIQWSPPSQSHSDISLKKLVGILPTTQESSDSPADPDGAESTSSHVARTASTDHSWAGAQGLLTPPESTSSLESAAGSDYLSCEMLSESQHDFQVKETGECGPGPFILFRSMPTAVELGDQLEAESVGPNVAGPMRKAPVTSRFGHRFKRLSKVVSLSTTVASSMTSRAVSNPLQNRPAPRERNILQAVVV